LGLRSSATYRRAAPLAAALAAMSTLLIWADAARAAPRVDHEAATTWRKVSWDDFRGPVINGRQVAWIAATVALEPIEVDVVQTEQGDWLASPRYPVVYALMDKLQSGVRPGKRVDYTLAHEQVHFDIAEVHARRLHRALQEIEVRAPERSQSLYAGVLRAAQEAWQRTLESLSETQHRYDGETGHGLRKKAQKKWAREVAEMLAAEEAYPLL
jgi:hypothetical protein